MGSRRASRTATVAAIATTAIAGGASLALAVKPLKSHAYVGVTAHGKDAVTLTVSKNGRAVKASIPAIPVYCQAGGPPETQSTKPAAIKGGRFSGTVVYRFQGKYSFKAQFSGHFTSRKVIHGTLRSVFTFKGCNGITTFTAKA